MDWFLYDRDLSHEIAYTISLNAQYFLIATTSRVYYMVKS